MGFPVPFAQLDARGVERASRATSCSIAARASAALIDPAAVDALLRDHAAGRTDGGDRIWSLLNLELWHRTFIDKEGRADACPMRILWLKSDLLLPLDKGGKLRTWHLMRHLARRHEITYLAFAEPAQPAADVDGHARGRVARRDDPARRAARRASLRFYADAALHLVDPLPYAVAQVPVGARSGAGSRDCSPNSRSI